MWEDIILTNIQSAANTTAFLVLKSVCSTDPCTVRNRHARLQAAQAPAALRWS
jgi:hypothetical protein